MCSIAGRLRFRARAPPEPSNPQEHTPEHHWEMAYLEGHRLAV